MLSDPPAPSGYLATEDGCVRVPRPDIGIVVKMCRGDRQRNGERPVASAWPSRTRNDRWRPVGSARLIGDMPPAWRNHLDPTASTHPPRRLRPRLLHRPRLTARTRAAPHATARADQATVSAAATPDPQPAAGGQPPDLWDPSFLA